MDPVKQIFIDQWVALTLAQSQMNTLIQDDDPFSSLQIDADSQIDQVYVRPAGADRPYLVGVGCPLPRGLWKGPIAIGGPRCGMPNIQASGDWPAAPRMMALPTLFTNWTGKPIITDPWTNVTASTGTRGPRLIVDVISHETPVLSNLRRRPPKTHSIELNNNIPSATTAMFVVPCMGRRTVMFSIVASVVASVNWSVSGFMARASQAGTAAAGFEIANIASGATPSTSAGGGTFISNMYDYLGFLVGDGLGDGVASAIFTINMSDE